MGIQGSRARRFAALAATGALIAFASVACGEEQVADEPAPAAAAPPMTVTVTTPATPSPAAPEVETPDAPPATEGAIKVPDVVGKDHQLAQDTMQAAGLYNLAEEDATGEGRLLLWDRNWVVVSQSPAGGSRVAEDTTIVLRSTQDDQ